MFCETKRKACVRAELARASGDASRALRWLAVMSAFSVLACSSDDGQKSDAVVLTGGTGATIGGVGGEPAGGTGGVAGTMVLGGAGGALAGAGGTLAGAGGIQAGSGGSPPIDDPDASMSLDGSVDDAALLDAGPIDPGPTDYGAPGPYEVAIEKNVGGTFRNNVSDDTLLCASFIAAVGGSNPEVDEQLTTYPADMERGLYTMFRPEPLEEGKKYPVITWGNGTCSHPLLFEELLRHIASHGFIIVASNSRWVSGGVEMLRGLDYVTAANMDSSSTLYGHIDTSHFGVSGHSQGSMATVTAAKDPRIVAAVPIQGAGVADARALHSPTFFIAGELDTLVAPAGVEDAYDAATVPAVYGLSMGQDHLMPGLAPTPILDAVTAWFRIHLAGDDDARALFYGADCSLCDDSRWMLKQKNL